MHIGFHFLQADNKINLIFAIFFGYVKYKIDLAQISMRSACMSEGQFRIRNVHWLQLCDTKKAEQIVGEPSHLFTHMNTLTTMSLFSEMDSDVNKWMRAMWYHWKALNLFFYQNSKISGYQTSFCYLFLNETVPSWNERPQAHHARLFSIEKSERNSAPFLGTERYVWNEGRKDDVCFICMSAFIRHPQKTLNIRMMLLFEL